MNFDTLSDLLLQQKNPENKIIVMDKTEKTTEITYSELIAKAKKYGTSLITILLKKEIVLFYSFLKLISLLKCSGQ